MLVGDAMQSVHALTIGQVLMQLWRQLVTLVGCVETCNTILVGNASVHLSLLVQGALVPCSILLLSAVFVWGFCSYQNVCTIPC